MKENLVKLTEIVSLFDEDSFYTNAYDSGGVRLQGNFRPQTIKKATELGFVSMVDGQQGWITMEKENIIITLT